MNLYNVLLNNKIPFVLHESGDSENVIYCKSFSDYLFNVGTFTTRTKEVILEYVVDNAEKYVVADVTFDNGECYRDVRFKVVVNENTETPYSTINLNLLNNKTQVTIPQQSQQIVEDVEELVERPAPVHISAPIIEAPDYTETINEALKLQKKLNVEKEEIKKQKILLEKQDIIKRKLSEYKQELLEDYFNATKRQTELLESNIQENITTAEYELNQRITNTFNDFNLQLEEYKNKTKEEQIQLIVKKLGETAATIKLEITDIISNKFNSEHEQVVDLLYEKTKLLEETYQRKLIFELEQYKERLFEEYKVFSSDTVEQVLKAKTDITYQAIDDAFDSRQAEIEEYYDNRLIESRQEIDNFAAEIKAFSTHLTELEKAFLESEEKFKNTLTEKEKVFAESLDQKITNSKAEFSSIVAEFTKRLPVITSNINTLETKVKTLIEEKTKSFKEDFSTTQQDYIAKTAQYWARRILDLGGGGGSVAVQYANGGVMNGNLSVNNVYSNSNTGEIGSPTNRWDKIYANQIDSLSANIVVELSGFYVGGDFTVNGVVSALGGDSTQWNSVYSNVNNNSANWDDTYTTVKNFSASWEESAEIIPTVTNYLSTNNIVLSSATITDYLSTDTIYSSGTVGVISDNINEAGNGENTLTLAFQNGIFIENNLTSFGVISTGGGTSNNWNSTHTVLCASSANWNTAYTNLVSNSSNYLSGASVFYVNTNFVKLSGDTMTGTLSAPKIVLTSAGSSSSPAIILSGTSFNSGIYLTGSGDGISINTRNNYTNLSITSQGVFSDRVIGTTSDGSAAFPSVYVGYETNSGLFRPAANNIGVSIAGTERVRVNSSGLTVTGNISASATGYFNHVAAATKSFYIPHPTKPSMHLQYGSLESPYHGIRLTGNGSVKSGDSVVIQLPDYVFSLVHQEGVNIQLTNYQHNKTLFVDDIDVSNNTFTVKCEKKLFDKGEYKFFWSFTAIRKDIPKLETEI